MSVGFTTCPAVLLFFYGLKKEFENWRKKSKFFSPSNSNVKAEWVFLYFYFSIARQGDIKIHIFICTYLYISFIYNCKDISLILFLYCHQCEHLI